MTTTTTTELRSSHSSPVRRNVVAAFAGAAILAATAIGVGRINGDDSPRVARATNESTLGVTQMYGAFHAAAPYESTLDITQMNGAFHAAFVPPEGVAATPLQGLGDIVAGSSFLNRVAAAPLQGLGDIVAGLVGQR